MKAGAEQHLTSDERHGDTTDHTTTTGVLIRRTQATYADATTTFAYDTVGRLVKASDTAPGAGTIDFAYDILDRLIQETTPQGTVAYQYDVLGRRSQMVANGQQPTSYQYDAASRLTRVAQGSLFAALGYDNANRRASLSYSNGTTTSYAYDLASRLTNITHNGPSGVIDALTYTYDAVGNRFSADRTNGTASLLPTALASAAYDAANEQTQFAGASLTYDANGNLTGDGVNTYQWDARNRLIGMSGGATALFAYDPLGRRASKTINGTSTQFAYDGNDIAAEIGSGAIGASYLRSLNIDEPFIRQTSTGNEHYHTDTLGSSLALSNAQGSPGTTYTYEPFGRTTVTGTSASSFQYTGREQDGTGLYYNRLRYYDSRSQRFISEDSLGLLGGVNLYSYVLNNPIAFTDPLGLDVTVTLYPGAGPFGHIGAGINTAQTVGLYPAPTANPIATAMGLNVDGFVHPDLRRPEPGQTITIRTSPQQDEAMLAVINAALAKPPQYNLFNQNCSLFVQDVLRAGGLQVPNTIYPRTLMNYLQTTY